MAKDVITRFKLETTQYDSKLKNASKELSDYSKTATQAKEGFNQFTKANVDAAKALGTMATSSNNAKQKTQELVGAFNEAAKAYNSLTKEQQQSDWAKALAGSLTTLQQRIKDTKQEMQGLGDEMKKGGGLFGGGKLDGMLQVFGGNLMTKAAGFAASFASEIGSCVQQGIELARQGEGIRNAFERLGRGDILDGLREATHGTVTDIELMKAAVKFNDFKLPVEELGTMLAFAQQKAKDTGQSVDYMVDSIVTGLGRKSLMILDNLGLSAAEIKEKMKQTGDMTKAVGAIIREQMAKAGDYVETAADRAAQANVSLQNKMEELGRKFAPVEEASNQLWTSMKIGILDIIGGPLARLLNGLTEAGRLKNMLDDLNGGSNGKESQTEKALRMLREYSGGGRGIEGKRDLYNRQVASYTKQEENAWRNANRLRAQLDIINNRKGKDPAGYDQSEVDHLTRQMEAAENRAKAIQIMRANYQKGAEDIFNPKPAPTTPVVPPTKPTKTTKTDIQFADDSIMAQEKLVSDLTQKWKTASGELRDGYLKDLEEAQKKLAEMTGKAKGPDLDKLFPEVVRSGGSSTSFGQQLIQSINQELAASVQNADVTALRTLLETTIKNSIEGIDIPTDELMEKIIGDGSNIPDEYWKNLQEQINEKLKEKGLATIDIDFTTGKSSEKKEKTTSELMVEFNKGLATVNGGINSVVGGIQQLGIEIPQEIQGVVSTISGISSVITGIAALLTLIEANTAATAGASIVDAIVPLAGGGIVPRAAFGRLIPGNSFSGDNLFAGNAMVNSGELVLNRAQQGVLASELQGRDNGTYESQPYLDGELIYLGLQAYMRRSGKGEIVTANR